LDAEVRNAAEAERVNTRARSPCRSSKRASPSAFTCSESVRSDACNGQILFVRALEEPV
jgi:hypothetical protein